MPTRALFPTLVYVAKLPSGRAAPLNRELRREAAQLAAADGDGLRWSARHYPNGYTSYGSLDQLHRLSSTFESLEKRLRPHVHRYARELCLDLTGRELTMTDCWINVMARNASHGQHLHPNSTISGTYYVQAPRGAPGLKFEDPRLERFMASPPRRGESGDAAQWMTVPAVASQLVLFESWLRHEVPVQRVAAPRISVSFNYHWC
jgi:uncharacterized protein (TIGR02466 family)